MLDKLRSRLGDSVAAMARDSVWTLAIEASMIVSVTLSFLMLGRQLGPEGYGEYVGLLAFLAPLRAIGSGASLALLQAGFQEGRSAQSIMRTYGVIVAGGGVIASVIVASLAPLVLPTLTMASIISFSVAELVVQPSVQTVGGTIRVVEGLPPSARVQLVSLFVRLGALAALFLSDTLTIERLGYAWLASSGLVLLYLTLRTLPAMGIRLGRASVARSDISRVGALGAPIYVGDFQTNGDKVVLNGAGLQEEAGLYGAAFRVAQLATAPLRAMDVAVFPKFLESDADQPGAHVRRARRYTAWTLLVVVPIALVVLVTAPLLELVVGDEFGGSVTMTRWLMLWLPIAALSRGPITGLLALGRLGLRLLMLIASASLSMVLYLLLIPDMGWEGAVIGTVVSEAFLAAAGWGLLLWSQRRRDVEMARHVDHAGDGFVVR